MATAKVSISKYIKDQSMEIVFAPEDLDKRYIETTEINRPGLLLTGYEGYFNGRRIQIIGLMEHAYLENVSEEVRNNAIELLFSKKPVLVVITRGLPVFDYMIESAKKHSVPILRTNIKTSDFMSSTISFLNVELAPMVIQHGELIDVFGEGIMILGNSGIGKSETAIELINRGHRLVADDTIEIRRVSDKTLVGQSPENIKHFMELRGIGIVNIRQLYGTGAIMDTAKIDLVINLEEWNPDKNYHKIAMIDENTDILGIQIPMITIPVRPGRNLAVIIEVAAMNFRNKRLGYDAEHDLLEALGYTDDLN